VTTGYDLLFVDIDNNATKLTVVDRPLHGNVGAYAESNMKYLKASDDQIVFINILGDTYILESDNTVNNGNMTHQLDSLFDKTFDDEKINSLNDNFYKFKNTRTYMFATCHHLYCRLASNKKTYQLS